jgi:large subunit ribosomal protein L10
MARPDKAGTVAEITEALRGASAAVLTEYRGLTVAQLKELRRSLAPDATYAVVKNTLTKRAAREAGLELLETLLEGPSAIAFVTGDPVAVAKGIREFARANPALIVKGGVLDGRPLTADEIRRLADLESREVLLAKLAGAMQASLSQAVSLFAAPLAQAARLFGALQAKAGEDASAAGPVPAPAEAEPAEPSAAELEPAEPTAVEVEPESAPAAEAEPESAPAAEAEPAEPTADAADTTAPSEA